MSQTKIKKDVACHAPSFNAERGACMLMTDSLRRRTELENIFASPSAEIVRAVPESVISCIACMVFEAHRTGPQAGLYLPEGLRSGKTRGARVAARSDAEASSNDTVSSAPSSLSALRLVLPFAPRSLQSSRLESFLMRRAACGSFGRWRSKSTRIGLKPTAT
jgi:hypothetical protein